ncbi:3-phosphoshikimate 1-carboxyvinyltransferase [Mesotoga sp. B105.6.4]|uniref:3-phosphoshikimate 1-carboxyvinyltransferase n=1 Tax=Mesotoga sp. B105.6.4 TaxID=1582224 RepID=UPI000CCC1B35|nr:3-phosphoshikimate 1-carboxyvinyltransferase [Mesotoga sp. B105.6.4]PNS39226.1 3-phosphoshikimate 1-carboxyvinyltransferase [Mesotoga sp. B105.6.4]
MRLLPSKKVAGEIAVPPDKSISHRALMMCSMCSGVSVVHNLLESKDTLRTFRIISELGGGFNGDFDRLEISQASWKESSEPLYCGNSGTTARLMAGVLAGKRGTHILFGDESLSARPMRRVIAPLKEMGARISARQEDSLLPMCIAGGELNGCDHSLSVASAQVKSAILLAGIQAEGVTTVTEPHCSRDHTERLLQSMGARISVNEKRVEVERSELLPIRFSIPGDISSAAFLIALAVLHENGKLTIRNVGLNGGRTGFLRLLISMGADIELEVEESSPEPVGTIVARPSRLRGVKVGSALIPSMIDELPLIALAGAFAEGTTTVRGAGELRKKESDRISVTVQNFRRIGVEIHEYEDGFSIEGPQRIMGGKVDSYGDHRIAMLFSIAGLLSEKGVEITNTEAVGVSFPGFFETLEEVCR